MVAGAPAVKSGAVGGKSLGAYFAAHHGAALAAGGVGVVGLLAVLRGRSKAASTAGAIDPNTGQPYGQNGVLLPMSTPNNAAGEVLASLQPEIDAIAAQVQNIPKVNPPPPGITPGTWGDPTEVAAAYAAEQAGIAQAAASGQFGSGGPLSLFAAARALGDVFVTNDAGVANINNPATGQKLGAGVYNAYLQSNPYLAEGLALGRAPAWTAALSGNIPPAPAGLPAPTK